MSNTPTPTTHHTIVVRHMQDGTWRTGSTTGGSHVAHDPDEAVREHIADAMVHGEIESGDLVEIERITD